MILIYKGRLIGLQTIVFVALFFFSAPDSFASSEDFLSTETLQRLVSSTWIESRHYPEIIEPERWRLMRQDYAFDAWLSDSACSAGYDLLQSELDAIQWTRILQENNFLTEILARDENPSSETIFSLAEKRGWIKSFPERFEVWYLFIDDSHINSEIEKSRRKNLAQIIRSMITSDNFEVMARLWSDAPSSVNGGYLGVISLDKRGPTFSAHVRQTSPGTISDVLRTPSGWNIIYVKRRIPAEQPQISLDELTSITARALAYERVTALRSTPHEFYKVWNQFAENKNATILEELKWQEHLLLAKRYVYDMVKQIQPSEDDLRDVFDNDRERFTLPPRKRAREILLTSDDWTTAPSVEGWFLRKSVRDRAREIRQAIIDGADFAEIARNVSAAPTASSGGDMGWIQMPSSYLVDTTLADLKPGEISPPMARPDGYWLAQLLEVEPQRRQLTFEEARPDVISRWRSLKYHEYLSMLREKWKQSLHSSANPDSEKSR